MLSPRGGRPTDALSSKPPGMGADGRGRVLEWEVGLPAAEELTPLSHPLIPRALAAAFRIDVAGAGAGASASSDSPTSHLSLRGNEDDDEDDDGDDEEGETTEDLRDVRGPGAACRGGNVLKKRRMVWTPELHRRFVAAVSQLGDKAAVPKAIMEVMNVEGMTREHVASHLQKYRVYLKRTRTTNAAHPGAMAPIGPMTPPTGDRSSPATATSTTATNKKSAAEEVTGSMRRIGRRPRSAQLPVPRQKQVQMESKIGVNV